MLVEPHGADPLSFDPAFVNVFTDAALVVDREGRVHSCNSHAEALLGQTGPVTGLRLGELLVAPASPVFSGLLAPPDVQVAGRSSLQASAGQGSLDKRATGRKGSAEPTEPPVAGDTVSDVSASGDTVQTSQLSQAGQGSANALEDTQLPADGPAEMVWKVPDPGIRQWYRGDGQQLSLQTTFIPLQGLSASLYLLLLTSPATFSAPATTGSSATTGRSAGQAAEILQNLSDAVIQARPDGQITSWNRGAEQLYGYAASEVVGQEISSVFPARQRPEYAELDAARQAGTPVRELETSRERKDGAAVAVSISSTPVFDRAGELLAAVTVERDMGDRRERELDLQAAKEQAEAANRTKAEFVANISHELRTPMNAILGMIDLARRHPQVPQTLHDYLATAHDAARSMLSLVNDLLDFSRLDAGKLEVANVPFRLRETIDEVMQFLALRARDHCLEFACHIRPDVPDLLLGDARRFRQVLLNLVGNAIKFTPDGEVVVHVDIDQSQGDQVRLHLSVRDTGIGIPQEDYERIFEPFMQVDASDTRVHGGSGLGLAISRKIADLVGGKIWCEPNRDHGTVFHYVVPFRMLQINPALPESTLDQLRGRTVFIVEGHDSTRELLRELTASWNLVPTVAANPEEAAEGIVNGSVETGCDIVLLDAGLKDRQGDVILQQLQDRPLYENVVLLIPSGEMEVTRALIGESAQVETFIERPISQSDLLEGIVRAVKGLSTAGRATWMAPIPRIGRSLRILVAEDMQANQKVVQTILKLRGHLVDVVGNGQQAVTQASQKRYDVILMDLRMPILSGVDAARQIRQLEDPAYASVPILALTAHVLDADRERCLAVGMNGYITKPIDADDLVRVVEETIGKMDADKGIRNAAPRAEKPRKSAPPVKSPPASPPGKTVINVERALARIGNARSLLIDLAQFFLEDVPQLAGALIEAIDRDDLEEALRAAHSIKGLAANFDATELQEIAASMERVLREKRLTTARELHPRLLQEIEAVCRALKAEVLS